MSNHESYLERSFERMQEDGEMSARCLANLEAILSYSAREMNVASLYHSIYKFVPCGPWLAVKLHDGKELTCSELDGVKNEDVRALEVGSIVEGSDAYVDGEELDLVTHEDPEEARKAFWEIVERVNKQASDLWEEAHGDGGGAEDDDPVFGIGATSFGLWTASDHRALLRLRKQRPSYASRSLAVKIAIEWRVYRFGHIRIRDE